MEDILGNDRTLHERTRQGKKDAVDDGSDVTKALLLIDREDCSVLDRESESPHFDISWHKVDYSRLQGSIPSIRAAVASNGIDLIMFSRNEQMYPRPLIGSLLKEVRTGYSSFSGIDERDRVEQMSRCFEDLTSYSGTELSLDLERVSDRPPSSRGTFSLIFDTEQLGGVRYGLPRLMPLLQKRDVRVTFYVTNIISRIYPGIVDGLKDAGHEVGIHGWCHEHLDGRSMKEQEKMLGRMARDLGPGTRSANLIGRFDLNTIRALAGQGFTSFVFPRINYFRLTRYPKLSTDAVCLAIDQGNIAALPISVETYGLGWSSIKNMVDSASLMASRTNRHLTILCHPFFDGSQDRIGLMERLLDHLIDDLRMSPLCISEVDPGPSVVRVDERLPDILGCEEQGGRLPRTRQDLKGMMRENIGMLHKTLRHRLNGR